MHDCFDLTKTVIWRDAIKSRIVSSTECFLVKTRNLNRGSVYMNLITNTFVDSDCLSLIYILTFGGFLLWTRHNQSNLHVSVLENENTELW